MVKKRCQLPKRYIQTAYRKKEDLQQKLDSIADSKGPEWALLYICYSIHYYGINFYLQFYKRNENIYKDIEKNGAFLF